MIDKQSMRRVVVIAFSFLLLFNISGYSQEWKSLKRYKKETGNSHLIPGAWLKKDRKHNTDIWKEANTFNLKEEGGFEKYKSITEIRDLYKWLDFDMKNKGHEVNAFGIAAVVAGQLSYFDNGFIRTFIVRNKQVVWFGNEGSTRVLKFAFELANELNNSNHLFKGEEARNWDIKNGELEQCVIIEALYNTLDSKAVKKLDRMAKGKGIYFLGVPKELKFEGDILNCKTRVEHAQKKVYKYYIKS